MTVSTSIDTHVCQSFVSDQSLQANVLSGGQQLGVAPLIGVGLDTICLNNLCANATVAVPFASFSRFSPLEHATVRLTR